jgi:hypothetical protein
MIEHLIPWYADANRRAMLADGEVKYLRRLIARTYEDDEARDQFYDLVDAHYTESETVELPDTSAARVALALDYYDRLELGLLWGVLPRLSVEEADRYYAGVRARREALIKHIELPIRDNSVSWG